MDAELRPEPEVDPAATRSVVGWRPGRWSLLEGAWAIGVASLLLLELLSDREWSTQRTIVLCGFGLLAAGPLAVARRHPIPAFAVNSIGVLGLVAFGGPSDVYQYTNLVTLYFVAAGTRTAPDSDAGSIGDRGDERIDRTNWWTASGPAWVALFVGVGGVLFYFGRFDDEGSRAIMAMVVLLWCSVWLLGLVNGSRRDQQALRAERDLSTELAEARRLRLELASDRADMARELHDILGHTLNVMLVHAGAARRALPDDAETAIDALGTIETTGRTAMDDLDRVLGLLRGADGGGPADRRPLPGLAELPELVATVDGSSPASISLSIDPDLDPTTVGRPVQLAAYRIVQEALTNVLKHAGAETAAVHVTERGDDLELTVADDGRGADLGTGDGEGAGNGVASSRGLDGMRERARLHGGAVSVTQQPGGGTLVTARLPRPSS